MLSIHELSVSAGDAVILDSVSLEIQTGGVTAVIGPNGAGKSTLLKAIVGIAPCSGTIAFQNRALNGLDCRSRSRIVSYMPQMASISSNFCVRDFIALGCFPWSGRVSQDEMGRRVDEAIERCMLESFARRPVQTLSGGERQRAQLAQVIVQNTPVMLLDEPTVFLDIKHQMMFESILNDLRGGERAIVYVSHDIHSAMRVSDAAAGVKQGRIALSGPPRDVMTRNNMARLFDADEDQMNAWLSPALAD